MEPPNPAPGTFLYRIQIGEESFDYVHQISELEAKYKIDLTSGEAPEQRRGMVFMTILAGIHDREMLVSKSDLKCIECGKKATTIVNSPMAYFNHRFILDFAGPLCEKRKKCEASYRKGMSELAQDVGMGDIHKQYYL